MYKYYCILLEPMDRKLKGGTMATAGYLLSPLSFWNDLFINIPLAYGFGILTGLISSDLFLPGLVIGYWITNVAGFILMHKGAKTFVSDENKYSRQALMKDIGLSIAYTILIVVIVQLGWVEFPAELFQQL